MRIILSRKGFDSAAGGAPSPIIDGHPISLPIPAKDRSATSYADLGLGDIVEQATGGRITRDHLCHDDPMFIPGECLFGQCHAAQSHLRNQGVRTGDIFLFFGLFADEDTGERHHRIFGYLEVADILSPPPSGLGAPGRLHPHGIGQWHHSNTVYRGPGQRATSAHPTLRLTRPGGPLRHWLLPDLFRKFGLTYHPRPENWLAPGELLSASRGQEFVCDIGTDAEARRWLARILDAIRG